MSLPPRLAGMTPCRITQKRMSVMPSSRARMTTVIHHGISPIIDSVMKPAPVSALSAIGSATLPKSVTRPLARARSPSMRSVMMATAKTPQAHHRVPVSSPPWRSTSQTKTGTSRMRMTVRALGRFHGLGARVVLSVLMRVPPP